MKKYLRCKVCGFVLEEKALHEVCPACNAPRTAFASYADKINDKRLARLNLHLHPVLVHFPQSLAMLSLIFIIVAFLTKGALSDNLLIVESILSAILPIVILIAMGAGLFDARLRFKKKFGPLLKRKVLIGATFFFAALINAVLINQATSTTFAKVGIVVLSLVCFICSGLLGKIGGSLLDAKIPG
ncbi:MAG: rubredoxin-type Fe(Cys)4 protein [Clostridia bacterium]